MADQRMVYNTMRRTTDSQESAGKRQRKIIFALVGALLLAMGAVKMLSGTPVASQNSSQAVEPATR